MNIILAPKQDYHDMRDAFFEELFQIASKDKDVILLMADQGAVSFKKFEEKIPSQIINVGISEQNMISVAAGLALSGKKVFVHAIANFTTLRCYEQIKVDLSIMKLPVTIAGIGAGFTYGSDGPTHHASQDIGPMRAIPGIRILNASDTLNLSAFPHIAYQIPQLTYIRFTKGNYVPLYNRKHNFLDGIGEIIKGEETVIISTGIMVHQAKEIVNQLKSKVGVIDIYQLKPLNKKKLKKLLSPYKKIIVLEEHLSYGGLATIIADFLADQSMNKQSFSSNKQSFSSNKQSFSSNKQFLRIGLPDENAFIYGDINYMHEKFGLSSSQIIKKINKFIRRE